MGQTRFLSAVHSRVRDSARTGAILDAYMLADELMDADIAYSITRDMAVRTVLAAGVVYGAPLLLDPYSGRRRRPARTPALPAQAAPKAAAQAASKAGAAMQAAP